MPLAARAKSYWVRNPEIPRATCHGLQRFLAPLHPNADYTTSLPSELEPFFKEQPGNYFLIGDLALTNMGLGDKTAALPLSERAIAGAGMNAHYQR